MENSKNYINFSLCFHGFYIIIKDVVQIKRMEKLHKNLPLPHNNGRGIFYGKDKNLSRRG